MVAGRLRFRRACFLGWSVRVPACSRDDVLPPPLNDDPREVANGNRRGILRCYLGAAVDTVLAHAESLSGSPATASSAERDAALAVLNGVLGDYLADTDSPFALPMRLRMNGQPLRLNRRALASVFASGNRKLLVAVHGLRARKRRKLNQVPGGGHSLGYFSSSRSDKSVTAIGFRR